MAEMEEEFLEGKDAVELKKELQKWVEEIVEADDYTLEATEHAMHNLRLLKKCQLKLLKPKEQSLVVDPPREYTCPISGELMKDPVVISSGQTFDRVSIQQWLEDGHRTCPLSELALSTTILTPNHLLREIISRWCKEHEKEMPSSVEEMDEEIIKNADHAHLNLLLEKLSSSSFMDQKVAAKEIRELTKNSPSSRALFREITDGIQHLLKPISIGSTDTDPDIQEDLITAVLNISVDNNNKKIISENSLVFPLLIKSLRSSNIQTRRNAAAAIFSLAQLDSNKPIIGNLGALKPLIELLEQGDPLAIGDATSAIFQLCTIQENKNRAVSEGVIRVIVQKLSDRVLIDELLTVLVLLSRHQKAIDEMGDLGALSCLLDILREEDTSERNKEHCIAILHSICYCDRQKLTEIKNEEELNRTISKLVGIESSTPRAKRKAAEILRLLNRYAVKSNTASGSD